MASANLSSGSMGRQFAAESCRRATKAPSRPVSGCDGRGFGAAEHDQESGPGQVPALATLREGRRLAGAAASGSGRWSSWSGRDSNGTLRVPTSITPT